MLNKAKYPARVRERIPELDFALDQLTAPVCVHHHVTTRMAETKWARKYLLGKLIKEKGIVFVLDALVTIDKLSKVGVSYRELMAGPDPPPRNTT